MNHPLPGPVSVPQPEPESPDLESVGPEASEATVAPLPSTIPATRPALPPTALEGEWAPILRHPQYRPFLDPVVRSVGRLHAWDKTGRTALGTVFVVGPQIVLTSAVDAPLFLSGQGDEVSTLAEVWPFVDFSAALGQREGTVLVRVRKARFVHPFFAVMALELDPLPSSITTLALASSAPSVLAGRTVALVSHDASGLVVQPGQMVQLGRHPQSRAPVLHHDCSAGVEGRGGPIVDLATGTVWAIQCAVTGDAHTLAEPTWELARDPRLWHQPIGFRPDPAPSWMDRWEVSASPETSSLASAATGFSVRIEPGSEPWNSLLGHLNELKLRSSEIVGIADGPVSFGDIESDHSPNEVWQQVLKLASRRGTLGELLTVVMLKFPFHAPALSRFISK